MRFSYKRIIVPDPNPVTGSQTIFRPIVPIRIGYGQIELAGQHYQALVDSGADWCLFHADVGKLLGIPISQGERRNFVGVGGKMSVCYFHPIRLLIGPFVVNTKAAFTTALNFRYGLLGQSGFFDRFLVTFNSLTEAPYVDIDVLQ